MISGPLLRDVLLELGDLTFVVELLLKSLDLLALILIRTDERLFLLLQKADPAEDINYLVLVVLWVFILLAEAGLQCDELLSLDFLLLDLSLQSPKLLVLLL